MVTVPYTGGTTSLWVPHYDARYERDDASMFPFAVFGKAARNTFFRVELCKCRINCAHRFSIRAEVSPDIITHQRQRSICCSGLLLTFLLLRSLHTGCGAAYKLRTGQNWPRLEEVGIRKIILFLFHSIGNDRR